MKRIKCYDKNGNSVNHLIQWDKNQVIYVDDLENGNIPEAHFALATKQDEARIYLDAVSIKNVNGTDMIRVIIPNELLLESTKLYVFLYYINNAEDDTPETTEYFVELPIKNKPRPSDQIYEDNLIFLSMTVLRKHLDELQEQVDEDEAILNEHVANIENPHGITCEQINALPTSLKGNINGLAELDENGFVPSSQLPSYVDDVINAYLYDGKMYTSASKENEINPESGKIYVDLNTENTYRWSGSIYVEISKSLALGETSSTAYRGDRGKIAYDHSQELHARTDATLTEESRVNGNILVDGDEIIVYRHPEGTNPHGLTASDIGLENVDNTPDADKPISAATQEAIESIDTKVKKTNERIDLLVSDGLSSDMEKLKESFRDIFYPVGTIYESVNNVNPSEFIGGTWVSWGAGKVSVGVDETQEEFNIAEKEGGEKEHVLVVDELPSHNHTFTGETVTTDPLTGKHTHKIPDLSGTANTVNLNGRLWNFATQDSSGINAEGIISLGEEFANGSAVYGNNKYTTSSTALDGVRINASHSHTLSVNGELTEEDDPIHTHSVTASGTIGNTGENAAHNNLQPYITSYKWKRTA